MSLRSPFLLLLAIASSACDVWGGPPSIYEADEVDVPPAIIGGVEAVVAVTEAPCFAFRAGIEGEVMIEAVVDAHGELYGGDEILTPVSVVPGEGIGGGWDEAVAEAVRERTRFAPARVDGEPVVARFRFVVPIQLDDFTDPCPPRIPTNSER